MIFAACRVEKDTNDQWVARVSLASAETVGFLYQTGSYGRVLAEMLLAQTGKVYIVEYITPERFGTIRTLESAAASMYAASAGIHVCLQV